MHVGHQVNAARARPIRDSGNDNRNGNGSSWHITQPMHQARRLPGLAAEDIKIVDRMRRIPVRNYISSVAQLIRIDSLAEGLKYPVLHHHPTHRAARNV